MLNLYLNLMVQVDKIYRHMRQGSYETRIRYYEAMRRFCRFLAGHFRLERLANLAPKHIYAYVSYLQERGVSASTIKTDLSAGKTPYEARKAVFRLLGHGRDDVTKIYLPSVEGGKS